MSLRKLQEPITNASLTVFVLYHITTENKYQTLQVLARHKISKCIQNTIQIQLTIIIHYNIQYVYVSHCYE